MGIAEIMGEPGQPWTLSQLLAVYDDYIAQGHTEGCATRDMIAANPHWSMDDWEAWLFASEQGLANCFTNIRTARTYAKPRERAFQLQRYYADQLVTRYSWEAAQPWCLRLLSEPVPGGLDPQALATIKAHIKAHHTALNSWLGHHYRHDLYGDEPYQSMTVTEV